MTHFSFGTLCLLAPLTLACGLTSEDSDNPGGAGTFAGTGGNPATGGGSATGGTPAAGGTPATGGVAGGGGASGSAGAAGSGGGGAGQGSCTKLTVEGERKLVDHEKSDQRLPVLVNTSGETTAALVYERTPDVAQATYPRLAQAFFDAWGPWPAADVPNPNGGDTFAVRSFAVGGTQGGYPNYSLLADTDDYGLAYMPTWGSGAWPLHQIKVSGGAAVFSAFGKNSHLIGYSTNSGRELWTGAFENGKSSAQAIACAKDQLAADAVWTGSSYLIATSAHATEGPCAGAAEEPASRLRLFRSTPGKPIGAPLFTLKPPPGAPSAVIERVRVVHGASQTWVVWKYSKFLSPEPIFGLRVDAQGNVSPAKILTKTVQEKDEFGVTALGDNLLLVRTEPINPISAQYSLLDASGNLLDDKTYIPLPTVGHAEAPYSLISDPTGTRALLAYAHKNWATNSRSISLVRFACN